MSKTKILLIALLFLAGFLNAQDMAVATVRLQKTEPISGNQLSQAISSLEAQNGRTLTKEERKQVLDMLIDQVLLIQAADADRAVTVSDAEVEKAGMRLISQQLQAIGQIPPGAMLTDPTQYRQVIEQQGVRFDDYKRTVRNQLLSEKYITTKEQAVFQNIPKATNEELKKEYQKRITEFAVSDSIWFNQIFFKTVNMSPEESRAKGVKAREVYRRLKNTAATFSELVASESEDEVSKSRGGLTGPVMEGDGVAEQLYGAAFMDKIFALNVGETSEVLQSNVGYHIIEVTKKQDAQLLKMDEPEVKSYLERIIHSVKYQAAFERATSKIMTDLRARATINYFGEYR